MEILYRLEHQQGSQRPTGNKSEDGRKRNEYFTRLFHLHTACRKYICHSRLNKFFINGLYTRLCKEVRYFVLLNTNRNTGALLETVEQECNTITAIIGSVQKRFMLTISGINPTTASRKARSSVAIVAPLDVDEDQRDELLLYNDEYLLRRKNCRRRYQENLIFKCLLKTKKYSNHNTKL